MKLVSPSSISGTPDTRFAPRHVCFPLRDTRLAMRPFFPRKGFRSRFPFRIWMEIWASTTSSHVRGGGWPWLASFVETAAVVRDSDKGVQAGRQADDPRRDDGNSGKTRNTRHKTQKGGVGSPVRDRCVSVWRESRKWQKAAKETKDKTNEKAKGKKNTPGDYTHTHTHKTCRKHLGLGALKPGS